MLFGKAVKIENCAACHDQSRWLCYTWIHVERPLNIDARPIEQHFLFFFDCKSRNQHQPVARPGDQENIFGRPRPNVSRLRRPGAVRAQPWNQSCLHNEYCYTVIMQRYILKVTVEVSDTPGITKIIETHSPNFRHERILLCIWKKI